MPIDWVAVDAAHVLLLIFSYSSETARLNRLRETECLFPSNRNYAVTHISAMGFKQRRQDLILITANNNIFQTAAAPGFAMLEVRNKLGQFSLQIKRCRKPR